MSRQSMAPNRQLTLTEELEKIEQSITLTLQEIDANFSRAHRIVTSSILPIVQQYAQHSNNVWENSRFWKEFFEASANISLSGYEDAAESTVGGDDTLTTFDNDDADATTSTARPHDQDQDVTGSSISSALERPSTRSDDQDNDESDLILSSPTATAKSTPRPQPSTSRHAAPAHRDPPAFEPDTPATPQADPFASATRATNPRDATATAKQSQDPLLHRILDKTYRIQATPRTARRQRSPAKPAQEATQQQQQQQQQQPHRTLHPALDSSPFSPAMQAPALRAEIFGPQSARRRRGGGGAPGTPGTARSGPRTPGVSVQRSVVRARAQQSGFTPGRADRSNGGGVLFASPTAGDDEPTDDLTVQSRVPDRTQSAAYADLSFYSDEEDEDSTGASAFFAGMSPPKTVALSLPARLVQTPAREASRRMVDDLMRTAGGDGDGDGDTTTDTDLGGGGDLRARYGAYRDDEAEVESQSPSVVRVARPGAAGGVDDSF